jgi:hypothetical protein
MEEVEEFGISRYIKPLHLSLRMLAECKCVTVAMLFTNPGIMGIGHFSRI